MGTGVNALILDEPQDFSAAVRASVERMPELHTIGEADLDRANTDTTVALIFLDEIRLNDWIACIVGLKVRQPNLRIMVVFGALTTDDLRALLAAGADAFVARSKSPQEINAALLALAEGSECLAPLEQTVAVASEAADSLGLTPREAEVLHLLISGFSNKEVARWLTLSVRTVETYRLNLRRKTQTGRLKDLVSLARQLGLVPITENEAPRRGTDYRYRE